MSPSAKIAIDLHGGDYGPSVLIPSCVKFFRQYPQYSGLLVGDANSYRPYVNQCPPNINWLHAEPIGDIAKTPSRLLRHESESSIEACYKELSQGHVDAVVSSEHTGVLLALMAKYATMHKAINRPVLASWLPTNGRTTLMLDLGASFTATSEQILTYAAIGVGLSNQQAGLPKIALLNIGTEYFKGPPELRLAHGHLQKWSEIDYCGFIEASEVFLGEVDVILTDGFTGNCIIKSSEGALDLTFKLLKDRLNNGFLSKVIGYWLKHELLTSLKPLDPRMANGAIVAGSDLLVVKSHGNAKEKAFFAAVEKAALAVETNVIANVTSQLDKLLLPAAKDN